MNGILLVNKEKGMTSRDIVNEVCKIFNTNKVGHTGTLDPMAEGVLVVAIGKSLKIIDEITSLDKEYIAEVTLGIETDTLDITGSVLKKEKVNDLKEDLVDKILNSFIGEYSMQVPIYSAVKVNGKKLYEYARNNIPVKLPVKRVQIYSIERISDITFENNMAKFLFKCKVSKGTYIRSLIRDISKELNLIGTMSSLTRVSQGKFNINDSYTLTDIKNGNYKLLKIKDVIDLPIVKADDFLYNKIKNGSKLENRYSFKKFCFEYNEEIIAIYETLDDKVKPVKVFVNN